MRFLFAVSLLFVACSPTEAQHKRSSAGSACPSDGVCGEGLHCDPYTGVCKEYCGKDSDCPRGEICHTHKGRLRNGYFNGPLFICLSPSIDFCSGYCANTGKCALKGEYCIATKDEDCAKSDRCKRYGECSLVDGECKLAKDEDCAKSDPCKEDGNCSLVDGRCRPTKDEHCAKSEGCKKGPRCSLVDGWCARK